jgi:DNA-directed RNA polymerase subunit M/transcription elongation factor TFIIS
MPPLTEDYKRKLESKKKKVKVIDLRKATDPETDVYICEHCDIRLIPYIDTKGERLTRGKLFQCGRCGQIKDTAMDNIQHPEALTSRGDTNQNIFFTHFRQPQPQKSKPYDPEPMNDEIFKGQGFHIVRTRVVAGDGKVLRDDSNRL